MTREELCAKIDEAKSAYSSIGEIASCERYGSGHINDTFLVIAKDNTPYIFQRINHEIFKNPEYIMHNISLVTEHIVKKSAERGEDISRATYSVIKTDAGMSYYRDSIGSYWRMLSFVPGTKTKDRCDSIEEFRDCGEAFGAFLCMLEDFDAEKLYEVIPNFHNTPKRYENLMRAVDADVCGRAESVRAEIEFCMERREFAETLEYTVTNYGNYNGTVLANLLVYRGRVIGGDICSADANGFIHGFSK